MPELPEVETTRRGIAPYVRGRRVARIDVYDSPLRWPVPADVDARTRGATIESVERRCVLRPAQPARTPRRRCHGTAGADAKAARAAWAGDARDEAATQGTTCAYRLIRSASLQP
jgi:hypothetical protein